MDQIQAMRIFARVVEAGTFTRAADSLQLPKGTVTKHVQALEERLRVKLLNRTTRRVTVTADGAAFYDRTVDLIGDNVDCVIRGGELADQSLVARRIGNLEFITVAAPAYLERFGVPAHPLDLERSHRTVIYFSPVSARRYPLEFRKDGEVIETSGPSHLAVNESNAYLNALVAGQGVGQITTFQAQQHFERGELVRVLPDWSHPLLPVYVVYPPNRHLSAKVRAFVDWAAELFANEPLLQHQ